MPGLARSRRWSPLAADEAAERRLVAELGLQPLVARVLAARGVKDPAVAREFLSPSLERDWEDPLLIPGMAQAVDRVGRALADHEPIAVFGDFDVDGMSASCLLALALRRLGGEVHPFIPHRFGEGYGLSREALCRVREACSPGLIVTVDNGIAAASEVAWLVSQGIDVVVTDHHEPADLVPEGVPVTDPKLDPACPSRDLAGAGVALKLVCELGRRLGRPQLWRDYTDVASLGTLSDMMPLEGENRALVADGISRMRRATRPGLVALAATAGVDLSGVAADTLPFSLIPRLNAAGRMGTTDVAFELLLTDDPARAAELAGALEATNTQRRETEAALAEAALAEAERVYHGGRSVVVGGRGWHEGVKGIVAARLTGRYHVPAIVFTVTEDGVARGSGRSVGSVDLFRAVEQCSDVLVRFGGHAGAVGVTCEAARLPEFRERLEQVLLRLPPEQFEDTDELTAVVRLSELNVGSIASLDLLQPFGQGNKRPVLAATGVTMRNRARVGADGAHLRFVATDGVSSVPAIMFRAPRPERLEAWDGAVDVVFDAVNETWQGRTKPKLMVKDVLLRDEPATSGAAGLADELFSLEAAGGAGTAPVGDAPAEVGVGAPAPGRGPGALEGAPAADLTEALCRRLIGDSPLLPAQAQALGRLGGGRSCLSVMATGRGKSLVFHVHAAREALGRGRASVFVYPLRALVADQLFHLTEALAPLGVRTRTLTGETPLDERDRTFGELADGRADVVLTTPEFLAIHSARFAESGRVGFLAVDEAHHAGRAQAERSAYLELPRVRGELGDPVCLACTATATSEVAARVCDLMGIARTDVLVDPASRDNLLLDDCRDLRDREAALVSVVALGEQTLVYATTRDQAVSLARMLRHRVGELAPRIAFYHAGLPWDVRRRVERAFRDGSLSCVVSTSAFGEGVNLPGVRHVVLYGLPLGEVALNQTSGRAGRDGREATVHLLFSHRDVRPTEQILQAAAPPREDLVRLWRTLGALSRGQGGVTEGDERIALAAASADPRSRLTAGEVACGIQVFSELGLLRVSGFGDSRRLGLPASPPHVDLARSVRYAEGLRSLSAFRDFCSWALDAPADDLLARLRRPIAPDFGIIVGRGEEPSHE